MAFHNSIGVLWRSVILLGIFLRLGLAQEFDAVAVQHGALERRSTTLPAPLSFSPDENWDGIDGQWSSFTINIGTPPQTVRVFVSTAGQQVWGIDPIGCPITTLTKSKDNSTIPPIDTDCKESRGRLFNASASTTYDERGIYSLWIEKNLGYSGSAGYGFDTITLGNPGEGGPTTSNVTIGHLGKEDFWLGIFGVNPKPTNFTNYTDPSPSWITMMFESKRIPSVAFGYTAGAKYRFSGVLASLTIGGFDTSRFFPSNVSFIFSPDNERDLLVSLNSITTTAASTSLLPSPIYSYIDSTVPEVWLPVEACQQFEQVFGITYDNATDLYFVDDTTHNNLVSSNPNITFTIAQLPTDTGIKTVKIVLPYSAFDHIAKVPYRKLTQNRNYFPLRRAMNNTQYTLGRAFLQESYLIVDWERKNFSVNPVSWTFGAPQKIVSIISPTYSLGGGTGQRSSGIGAGVIAGVAVGAAALLALVAAFLFWRRSQKKRQQKELELEAKDTDSATELNPTVNEPVETTKVIPKAELDATPVIRDEKGNIIEMDDNGTLLKVPATPTSPGVATYLSGSTLSPLVESDAKELQIFEMEGDMPARQEADGTQLSEKQAMMRREQIYNGIDPTSPVAPPSPSHTNVSSPTYAQSPTTPEGTIISPITPDHAGRRVFHAQDIIEVSPTTMGPGTTYNTQFLNPGTIEPRDPNRKRFSYEEPDEGDE